MPLFEKSTARLFFMNNSKGPPFLHPNPLSFFIKHLPALTVFLMDVPSFAARPKLALQPWAKGFSCIRTVRTENKKGQLLPEGAFSSVVLVWRGGIDSKILGGFFHPCGAA